MSLLIFTKRKLDIIHRQNDKNYRMTKLTQQISDLQSYAASIGDGIVSMSDMMHSPSSMLGRTMMFMQYSHNAAIQMTQQKMTQMQPMIAAQTQQMQDANKAAMYQQWVQQNLYNQAREYLGKMEARTLNEQEKQLQKEKTQLETEIKMLDQELKSVEQAEGEGIKSWAPKYV